MSAWRVRHPRWRTLQSQVPDDIAGPLQAIGRQVHHFHRQVDASFSCDKVSVTLVLSGLLTTFTKVDLNISAEKWKTTLIIGVQSGGSLKEVLGLGVKASVGTYVSLIRDGVTDYGMVGDMKSSVSLPLGDKMPIGQVKVGESAKAISVRWSFVTGDTEFDFGH